MDSMLENLKLKYHSFIMHDMSIITQKFIEDHMEVWRDKIKVNSNYEVDNSPEEIKAYAYEFNEQVKLSIKKFTVMLQELIIECLEEAKYGPRPSQNH